MIFTAGSEKYIDEFGSLSFNEKEFCAADSIALCEVSYMPFENIISDSFSQNPVSFRAASERMFTFNGYKHNKLGLMITNKPSTNMMKMSRTVRFGEICMTAVKEVYCKNPSVQFCGMTFILPNGINVIVFRGTNDDIAGWKEDVDLFIHNGSPSYEYALDYFKGACENLSGDFILCGHSKGGNVALHTALCCEPELRQRIKALYNLDGPGFYNHDIFRTGSYDELLPRYEHYIPSSSFIGVLLAHDYDYKAVKSNKHLGPLQHDMGTWQIKNGELVTVIDTDLLSKITDIWLAEIVTRASDSRFINSLDYVMTSVCDSVDARTLTEFVSGISKCLPAAVKAYKEIPGNIKNDFKESFAGSLSLLKDSVKTAKNISSKQVTEKLFSKLS